MIEIKNKQIIIDGQPKLIMCGEIHYYRLRRNEWQDRLDKLKAAGCNAVATYVPWICHEPEEGVLDFNGSTREELNLGEYIDLCHENGLYFFVRPGPFIMAEMKNDGIPHWVYEKHPEIIPIGWDERKATTPTLDYLAPAFLQEVKKWYEEVMKVIKPRLHQYGGNIIGVQLDNEIGMLSWVSNGPDLTDFVIDEFMMWLQDRYEKNELDQRYPFIREIPAIYRQSIRSPQEDYMLELHRDLGHYMRHRHAKYVKTLRQFAEACGVKDIPFIVNIHGTGGGRGFTYPIGISQLYESYTQDEGYLSGSDHYFGNLNMETFQDLYLINGLMDAVHNDNQPLTSVEFNCGDGNFGETYGGRYDPSAADLKTRMSIAQGNRMLNYYLFAGGRNYRTEFPLNDGNDRIATTGERHGFAAPVGPEGELNYSYPRMARSIQTMMAVSDKLAVMDEEYDDVAFGFIPDYYMTEYHYPTSEKVSKMYNNLTANRAHGAWEIMARAMLLAGYRFTAVDVQNKSLDPEKTKTIALPSARYMDRDVQRKLVEFLQIGGSLLLYGEVPLFDMEGKDCTILADALGVTFTGHKEASQEYFLSIEPDPNGFYASNPEVRTHFAQHFELNNAKAILRVYGTNEACGFESEVGKGKAVAITAAYRCDIELFRTVLEHLGANVTLKHNFKHHGIFMTTVKSEDERFLHILNLDGFDKEFQVDLQGKTLFDGRTIDLQSRDGLMLPLDVQINDLIKINYSTAEIRYIESRLIEFRLTQKQDVIQLETSLDIQDSNDYEINHLEDGRVLIKSNKHAKVDDKLVVKFEK
ncbi:beta-galactosidase [Bacillus sp. JJ1562]|uniref:beta-galactosidase n=1 Tax=Bacillus sp. JJ1562 TaxID=3122960 RepID=UPI003002469F